MNAVDAKPQSVPRLRDLLTPWSRLRYLAWRALGWPSRLTVQLADGPRLVLRSPRQTRTAGADDPGLAHEIFAWGCYRSPLGWPSEPVARIVDVGANVGFATAYFKSQFPTAKVVAIEPMAAHVEMIRLNAEANGWTPDVRIVAAAAGPRAGTLEFREQGPMSGAVAPGQSGSQTVPMVDFFEVVGSEPIDLLKMDIEGGEHAILADARFARLAIRTLVMEWHNTTEQPQSRDWCRQQLLEAGFAKVVDGVATDQTGNLWAYRHGT